MARTLLTDVNVIDGSGAAAYRGQVLVLGQIRPGYLADLLLVDGDPLAGITIPQDSRRLLGMIQGGAFHNRASGLR